MAFLIPHKKNPKCAEHLCPVEIRIPANEIGNAHGERWYCEECKGEPEVIVCKRFYF